MKPILPVIAIFICLIIFTDYAVATKVNPETVENLITEARNSFAIAKKENAEEYAPNEFARAQTFLQQAEATMAKKQNEKTIDLAFMADMEAKVAIAKARYEKAQYRVNKIKELQIDTILEIKSNEVEIAKTRQMIAERVALEAQINSEMSSETAENRIQRSQVDLAITKAEMAVKMAEQMNAPKYVKTIYDKAVNSLQEAKNAFAEGNFSNAIRLADDARASAENAQVQAKAKADTEFAETMKKKERALIAIAKAEVAIEEAKALMADKLAKDLYTQAEKTMQEVRSAFDSGDYEHARSLAEQTRVSASSARAVVMTKANDQRAMEELEEKKANALDLIARAERTIAQAFNAGAPELADEFFKQAQQTLEIAKQAFQNDDLDKTISEAQKSVFNSNLAIATSELKSGQKKKNVQNENAILEEFSRIPNVLVRSTEKGIAISFSIDSFDKNGKLTRDAMTRLKNIAESLKKYPDYKILVEGHTDNSGKEDANIFLSSDRASAVLIHLANVEGIPIDRLSSVGYGSLRPLVSNTDEAGRKQNRRIDIVLLTK